MVCTSTEKCGLLHPIGPLLAAMVVQCRPQDVTKPLLWGGTRGRNPDAADLPVPALPGCVTGQSDRGGEETTSTSPQPGWTIQSF